MQVHYTNSAVEIMEINEGVLALSRIYRNFFFLLLSLTFIIHV